MKTLLALFGLAVLVSPVLAQEQEDYAEQVAPIKGGAVYDEKIGVDGSLISDQYFLTHIVCSKGSKTLRVMLPLSPDDDGTTYTMDGPASTLKKTKSGYRMTFMAYGKPVVKDMQLKPTNDKRSQNAEQFVFSLNVGDGLWKAMTAKSRDKAIALIGTGGTSVNLPSGKKFDSFLKLCGL